MKAFFLKTLPLIFFTVFFHGHSYAGLRIEDALSVKGEPFMLRAETRGKIFRKGGVLVEFSVDGAPLGKTLSGGDGIAYMEFTPKKTGAFVISAKSGDEKAEGILLSVKKGSSVLFVEVSGGLFEGPFSTYPMKGSKEALERIAKKHPVAYVESGGFPTREFLKKWLKENNFPPSPLLSSYEIPGIGEKGIVVKALIGTPKLASEMEGLGYRTFTFGPAPEGTETVKDWEELEKALLSNRNSNRPKLSG